MLTPVSEYDYMNRSEVMQRADRQLMHYICNAAHYLNVSQDCKDDYKTLEFYAYKGRWQEWSDVAWMYERLVDAEMMAAKTLISSLENRGFISYWDWLTINHALNWFGIKAEGRYD